MSRLSTLVPAGRVVGLDVSGASAVVAQDSNVGRIEAGRVQILQGSAAALPFPGGTFAVIAEAYQGGPLRLIYGIIVPLNRVTFLSDAEYRDLLIQA